MCHTSKGIALNVGERQKVVGLPTLNKHLGLLQKLDHNLVVVLLAHADLDEAKSTWIVLEEWE
jgi:hypothetical protein